MDGEKIQRDRILLVDDEPNILATTQVILEVDGYQVDTASSGEDALQMMKETNYDLLIVDLNMMGMNGLELLEHTHSFFPQPLTIMLTGYASLESAIKALHLGAYDYLIKPCSVFDLKYSVKRALEHRRLSETESLFQVSRSINSSFDQEEILNTVACTAADMLGLQRGLIVLFDPNERDSGRLLSTIPCEGEPIGGELLSQLFFDHSEIRSTLQAGGPFACSDTSRDLRVDPDWIATTGACAFLVAPIIAKQRLFGLLYVDSCQDHRGFSSASLRLVQGLADQAAIALENARLYSEVVTKNQELAELNEKLTRLDKLKSNFLDIATHELRTPISIVLGYNTMLQEELQQQLNDDQNEMLAESISNCQRLINLINSMLDVSRIEAGKLEINITKNDLRLCIDAATRLLRERLRAKSIQLDLQLSPCLPLVPFDADRLQQVLINLIDNAIKFSQTGGKITIRALIKKPNRKIKEAPISNLSDQVLEVAIEDNGVGVPIKEQSLIFEEFEQSNNQNGNTLPSSGLGLAIAKKIIAAHSGQIWVESEVERGSKFIFQLPLANSNDQTHHDDLIEVATSSPKRTKKHKKVASSQ